MNSLRMLVLAGAVAVVGGCSEQPSVAGRWEGKVIGGKRAYVFMEDGQAQFLLNDILLKKEGPRTVRWALSSDKPADGYTGVLDLTLVTMGQEEIVKAPYKLEGDTLTLLLGKDKAVFKRVESKPTLEPDMSSIIGKWEYGVFYVGFSSYGDLSYPGSPDGARWRALADSRIRTFSASNGEGAAHDCSVSISDGWLSLNPAECFGDASLPDEDIKLRGPY